MKKLSKKEAEKIATRGKGRSTAISSALQIMKVGELIFIERREWTWKRSPSIMCARVGKSMGTVLTCKAAVDGSGWIVERVK